MKYRWYPRFAISATSIVISSITGVETFTVTPALDATDKSVKYSDVTSTTIIDAVKAELRLALSTGSASLDLTAVLDVIKGLTSLNGLKIQAIKIHALSTNANIINATFGASNPYNLMGAAWQVGLLADQSILADLKALAPSVGSGAKIIDFSGTGSQGVDITIIAK